MRVFLSHSSEDQAVASRIKAVLEGAGHVVIDMSDWKWGEKFVANMRRAVDDSDHMLALWSEAYFASKMCVAEMDAAWRKDEEDEPGYLLTAKIDECTPPHLYRTIIWGDLKPHLSETEMAAALLRQLKGPQAPESGPLNNLPAFHTQLHAREEALFRLTSAIAGGNAMIGQHALRGLGGIGKTTLALAFAHSAEAARAFPLRWWIPAETAEGARSALHALSVRLGLVPEQTPPETALAKLREWFETAPRDALLIFDNVESAEVVRDHTMQGAHILITTRAAYLPGVEMVELETWGVEETARFLMERTGDPDEAAATALAEELGGLPLAAEHSVAICGKTGMGVAG